jgi:hypothetical protein
VKTKSAKAAWRLRVEKNSKVGKERPPAARGGANQKSKGIKP